MTSLVFKRLLQFIVLLSLIHGCLSITLPSNGTTASSTTASSSMRQESLTLVIPISALEGSTTSQSSAASTTTSGVSSYLSLDAVTRMPVDSTLSTTSIRSTLSSATTPAVSVTSSPTPTILGTFLPSITSSIATSASASTSSSPVSSSSDSSSPLQNISQPAKIGVIAGASGVATAVTVVLFFCLRRPRGQRKSDATKDLQDHEDDYDLEKDGIVEYDENGQPLRKHRQSVPIIFHPDLNNEFHRPVFSGHTGSRYSLHDGSDARPSYVSMGDDHNSHTGIISSQHSPDQSVFPSQPPPEPMENMSRDRSVTWIEQHQRETEDQARQQQGLGLRQSTWGKIKRLRTWSSVVRREPSTKSQVSRGGVGEGAMF